MTSQFDSKHGIVSRQPFDLYMAFTDLRNFQQMLPEDKRAGITADFDTLQANVQGYSLGVKVYERTPYSKIVLVDYGAPFAFQIVLHFDATGLPGQTEFYIEVSAELNFMLKMMLGSKIKEALDKIVDSLVDISEGRMPEGIDPSEFRGSPFNM